MASADLWATRAYDTPTAPEQPKERRPARPPSPPSTAASSTNAASTAAHAAETSSPDQRGGPEPARRTGHSAPQRSVAEQRVAHVRGTARVVSASCFLGGECTPAQPMKVSRTVRSGLSRLVSTIVTDCHVPNASSPPITGSVACGGISAGNT